MRRARAGVPLAIAVLLVGALAACGRGGDDTTPPGDAATGGPPATSAGPAGSGAECHVGRFDVVSITSKDGADTPLGQATVQAPKGTLTLDVTDGGTWSMGALDGAPLTLTAGAIVVEGTAEGEVKGSYARSGDDLAFTVAESSGSVHATYRDQTHTIPMRDLAGALAPSGVTTVTCGAAEVTLSSDTVDLVLAPRA